MDLKNQRRMASELLKCGYNRVWVDPTRMEDVADAVTRGDIRMLIGTGAIIAAQKKGVSRGRARALQIQKKKGRHRGRGSIGGTAFARFPKKQRWIQTIRPIRRVLREFKNNKVIDKHIYRLFYRRAKGGMYKSKAHLRMQLKLHGVAVPEEAVSPNKRTYDRNQKQQKIKPKKKEERKEAT
ncbi:MAG: 50S ribosomal protein L19e [Thermoplasmata archaeon]